jgi:hypothetical protein
VHPIVTTNGAARLNFRHRAPPFPRIEPLMHLNVGVAMDDDLASLTREQLIAEVIRLRAGIRAIATAAGTICAGIIQSFGICCRSGYGKTSPSPTGLSFYATVSSTGKRSTGNCATRHGPALSSTKPAIDLSRPLESPTGAR